MAWCSVRKEDTGTLSDVYSLSLYNLNYQNWDAHYVREAVIFKTALHVPKEQANVTEWRKLNCGGPFSVDP
jgi:hypothetical protein